MAQRIAGAGARLRMAVLGLAGLALLGGLTAVALQLAIWRLPPLDLVAARAGSATVTDREGRLLRAFLTPDGAWRLPTARTQVDPRYLAMLLAFEDRRFFDHPGVDPRALLRIAGETARRGRIISGGSTLTMQVARILDGLPVRSFAAKWQQMARARWLETRLSKDEILQLYLLRAPFGGNIEGVRAASLAWFGHEPARLNAAEAALLIALPQAPLTRRPDRFAAAASRARNKVLARAAALGIIPRAEAEWAATQPVPQLRHQLPALAPHLAMRLAGDTARAGGDTRTTLDAPLQARLETIVRRHALAAGPRLSAALVVLDHASGEIRASVGSPGEDDTDRAGAIDMTLAQRSPGSALKPFIAGLAFEAGIAHPGTLIEDAPARFGDYAPKNFDDSFRGTVTVAEALRLSLNVPAVKLLDALGPAALAARFRDCGLVPALPRNLAVALGGAGVSLVELAGMYGALARGGRPRLPHLQPAASDGDAIGMPAAPSAGCSALLSPAAAWAVTRILLDAVPPVAAAPGRIAFKTGTSYGYRDAVAVGYDGRHVVAAWLGRPDMTATPGLSGLTASAPLLFEAFAALGPSVPLTPPAGLLLAASPPAALARFREAGTPAGAATATATAAGLRIAFPPQDAELEFAGGNEPFALRADGGTPPLVWFADGAPLGQADRRGATLWQPRGRGFAKLMVIDAAGRSAGAAVRIR